jgi:hypothetical protein
LAAGAAGLGEGLVADAAGFAEGLVAGEELSGEGDPDVSVEMALELLAPGLPGDGDADVSVEEGLGISVAGLLEEEGMDSSIERVLRFSGGSPSVATVSSVVWGNRRGLAMKPAAPATAKRGRTNQGLMNRFWVSCGVATVGAELGDECTEG